MMSRIFALIGLIVIALPCLAEDEHRPAPVRILYAPLITPSIVESRFAPVSGPFGQAMGRDVQHVFSRSVKEFEETLHESGELLAWVAAHDAARYVVENGFHPIMQIRGNSNIVLITSAGGPIAQITDLKGKVLALPGLHSMATVVALEALVEKRLEPEKDVQIHMLKSHDEVIMEVLSHGADAGATVDIALKFLTPVLGEKVAEAKVIGQTPGLVLIASPSTSTDSVDRLRSYATDAGVQGEIQTSMMPVSFKPIDARSLQALYDRVQAARKLLQAFQDTS